MSERNIVKYKLDTNNPEAQTSQQRKRLQQIVSMPDEQIDYSDIERENPSNAVRWTRPGALVSPENKQQVTLRLDADVLNFFKTTGKKYQSRINAALRE